ncbi:transcriptional regulator [Egicoccus sp. AB-alg2]|uniref:transcriptional regulator n=1 Tax=Egicoccus sp. AB-alg2 TaxID=3242693 RepID=UPI00359E1EB3
MSPGNLSTHLRKLEEVGYVAVAKAFNDRTPVTTVSLTAAGRVAHAAYVDAVTHYLDGSAAQALLHAEETT